MSKRRLLPLAAALLACSEACAEKRIALVVGNNAYESVTRLDRAVNDARAVSSTLETLGFQVQLATDLGRRDFIRQLSTFMDRVQPGDVAVLYYAGHGIEIRGVNYILPTDVPPAPDGFAVRPNGTRQTPAAATAAATHDRADMDGLLSESARPRARCP